MKSKKKYISILYIFIIMIFSLLCMNNARLIDPIYNNHLTKQLIWFIVGFIILLISNKININIIFKYSMLFYIFTIILLVLVLFIGIEVNGAKAWFDFKYFSFQPSELTKLSLAILLSNITLKYNKDRKNELKYIIYITLLTIIPSFLVFIEPDTGAIIFYGIIYITCLFNAKINKKWYILLITSIVLLIIIFSILYIFYQDVLINLIGTSFFYRVDRLINFTDNYQINNALTLIGSSSFFGNGINNITLFIPEAPTDFIFAYNIGNYGLFAGIITIILYYLLIHNFINLNKKANNKLFANIFLSIFIFQVIYNILMNVGLLPIMGIPLPFLSYGGTTLLIYFMFLSIYYKIV